eukprot:1874356-Prymnesium_polylepis.1
MRGACGARDDGVNVRHLDVAQGAVSHHEDGRAPADKGGDDRVPLLPFGSLAVHRAHAQAFLLRSRGAH